MVRIYLATGMSGILLATAYTALLLFLMQRSRFYAAIPGLPFPWVSAILVLKILAGMALWAVYTYIYPDRATADVFKYFDDSAHMFKALPDRPLDYLRMLSGIGNDTPEFRDLYYKDMNNWVRQFESNLYNDAHTIIRFNAFVRLFSFGEFHVHTVIAAFLSLTGLVGVYRSFVRSLPGLERALMVMVFLLPSVLFWASGVIKESLLFFGIGILLYQIFRLSEGRPRWRDPVLLAMTVTMLFFLKFYVLLSLLPALVLILWSRRRAGPPLLVKAVSVYGVFIAVGLNMHHIIPGMDILGILTMKQRDFVGLAQQMGSGSFVMPELLLPEVGLFLAEAPYAVYISLLGPMVHHGGGILGLVSALENAALLVVLGLCVLLHRPWPALDRPLILSIVLYVLVLSLVIGWTTPVMGAVVRYRTPLLPFLMIAGLLVLDRERLLKTLPWMRKFLNG